MSQENHMSTEQQGDFPHTWLPLSYWADKTFTSKSQRLNKGKEMFFVKQSR